MAKANTLAGIEILSNDEITLNLNQSLFDQIPAVFSAVESCRKAGLNPEAWHERNTNISIFSAEIFSEKDLNTG